jgi:hypothetical protein
MCFFLFESKIFSDKPFAPPPHFEWSIFFFLSFSLSCRRHPLCSNLDTINRQGDNDTENPPKTCLDTDVTFQQKSNGQKKKQKKKKSSSQKVSVIQLKEPAVKKHLYKW